MFPAMVPAMIPAMIPLLAVVLPATAQSPQCSGPLDKVRSSTVYVAGHSSFLFVIMEMSGNDGSGSELTH